MQRGEREKKKRGSFCSLCQKAAIGKPVLIGCIRLTLNRYVHNRISESSYITQSNVKEQFLPGVKNVNRKERKSTRVSYGTRTPRLLVTPEQERTLSRQPPTPVLRGGQVKSAVKLSMSNARVALSTPLLSDQLTLVTWEKKNLSLVLMFHLFLFYSWTLDMGCVRISLLSREALKRGNTH